VYVMKPTQNIARAGAHDCRNCQHRRQRRASRQRAADASHGYRIPV
jgi:hypothetical protein